MMDEILKDPLAHFARLLPKRLKDEGGPFVCLVQMKALPGNLDAMLEIMTAVHQETDEVRSSLLLSGCAWLDSLLTLPFSPVWTERDGGCVFILCADYRRREHF